MTVKGWQDHPADCICKTTGKKLKEKRNDSK